jgi:hypothetical protein
MNSVLRLTSEQRAELFRAAAQRLGFGEVIVEKDFWVCWTLRQLFTLPGIGEHLIFKGGTSLSKVWRAVARFSEDIDVSLTREWLGFTGERDPENAGSGKQQRIRIEELAAACATKVGTELLPVLREQATEALGVKGWAIAVDPDDAQTLRFTYPSALPDNTAEAYVRREVKIECGARSDAWPAEEHVIVPYVAEVVPAVDDAKVNLRVLNIERTFWEKATILHAEAHREATKATPVRYARHYADLAALADHASAARAVADDALRERVVVHKRVFFPAAWARYETDVAGTFRLVPDDYRLGPLETDYRAMREMYFGEPRPWAEIVARLRALEAAINRH